MRKKFRSPSPLRKANDEKIPTHLRYEYKLMMRKFRSPSPLKRYAYDEKIPTPISAKISNDEKLPTLISAKISNDEKLPTPISAKRES